MRKRDQALEDSILEKIARKFVQGHTTLSGAVASRCSLRRGQERYINEVKNLF